MPHRKPETPESVAFALVARKKAERECASSGRISSHVPGEKLSDFPASSPPPESLLFFRGAFNDLLLVTLKHMYLRTLSGCIFVCFFLNSMDPQLFAL